jgi:hypothetical protein
MGNEERETFTRLGFAVWRVLVEVNAERKAWTAEAAREAGARTGRTSAGRIVEIRADELRILREAGAVSPFVGERGAASVIIGRRCYLSGAAGNLRQSKKDAVD